MSLRVVGECKLGHTLESHTSQIKRKEGSRYDGLKHRWMMILPAGGRDGLRELLDLTIVYDQRPKFPQIFERVFSHQHFNCGNQ